MVLVSETSGNVSSTVVSLCLLDDMCSANTISLDSFISRQMHSLDAEMLSYPKFWESNPILVVAVRSIFCSRYWMYGFSTTTDHEANVELLEP